MACTIKYDVILDIAGKNSVKRMRRSLKSGGRLILANPSPSLLGRIPWTRWTTDKPIISGLATERPEDYEALNVLVENGTLKSLIDRRYELKDVPKAHAYVEAGLKKGNVVINIVSHKSHGSSTL